MKTEETQTAEYPFTLSWRVFAYRNRKLFMTKEGIFFSLIILGIGIAAINTGINLLYLIFAMTCSFMVLAGILSEFCLRDVFCDIVGTDKVFAGESFPLTVILHNDKKRLPSFSLRVTLGVCGTDKRDTFLLHRIPPRGSVKKTVLVTLDKRGKYLFQQPELSTRFPFNFGVKSKLLDLRKPITVFPKLLREERILELISTSYGGETKRERKSQSGEFAGSRQFQAGDNIKSINWKASSKGETTYVKEFGVQETKKLRIYFDPSQACSPEEFEEKVSLVASLIHYSSGWGYRIHLKTPERDFSDIEPESQGNETPTLRFEALGYLAEVAQSEPLSTLPREPFPRNEQYLRV